MMKDQSPERQKKTKSLDELEEVTKKFEKEQFLQRKRVEVLQ